MGRVNNPRLPAPKGKCTVFDRIFRRCPVSAGLENREEVSSEDKNYHHQYDGVGDHVTLPALEPDSSHGNIVVVNLNEH